MSVVVQIVVESRRYSGWTDPRYPIGYWQAAAAASGDASGGLVAIDLVFQTANGPARLNSQMYSVERFSMSTTEGGDIVGRIQTSNMGGPANLGFIHSYAILLSRLTSQADTRPRGDQLTMLPLFLGSQRNAGTTASFSFVVRNTDTINYEFEAEGYRWDPRSVLIDGGPQRPPTGLYAR